jgi:hypothetical protein
MRTNQQGAASVAPATSTQEEQLKEAFQAGRMGIGGAITSYPELTIQQIIQVAQQVRQGGGNG